MWNCCSANTLTDSWGAEMQGPGGGGSAAVDTHRVVEAYYDEPRNTITVHIAAQTQAILYRFPDTILGRQLGAAVFAQIPHAQQGGNWASNATVLVAHKMVGRLNDALQERGVQDLAELTPEVLHAARDSAAIEPVTWSSSRKALITALRRVHPDGEGFAAAIAHERLNPTVENPWAAYEADTAAQIEDIARKAFREWYLNQRRLLHDVGIDTEDRNWILLSAADILDELPAPPPQVTPSTGLAEQVAHAVYSGEADVAGSHNAAIDAALWPTSDTLTAGLIVMCLADDTGDNLAVMQSLTSNSIIYTDPDAAVVQTEKARAASKISVVASTAEFTSYAGVVSALIGLTRFARDWRQRNLDMSRPHLAALTGLVFVPHQRSPDALRLVRNDQSGLARRIKVETGESLNFHRLRATALKRQVERHGRGRAHITGQSEQQRQRYLAKMVPEPELAGLVIDAQDDIISRAREYVADMPSASERERQLAELEPADLVDVGTTTCGNRGNDPDTDEACGRGPLACFSCPVGYRTPANIPGLLAAVRFAERLRADDPDEFYDGDAQDLHHLSQATLAGFDADVIAAVDPDRVQQMLPLIGAIYFDLRT